VIGRAGDDNRRAVGRAPLIENAYFELVARSGMLNRNGLLRSDGTRRVDRDRRARFVCTVGVAVNRGGGGVERPNRDRDEYHGGGRRCQERAREAGRGLGALGGRNRARINKAGTQVARPPGVF